jgi:hypothetical protein
VQQLAARIADCRLPIEEKKQESEVRSQKKELPTGG